MKYFPGTAITVFLLFFGLSLVDAISSRNWPRAGLWFAFGLFCVIADVMASRKRKRAAVTPSSLSELHRPHVALPVADSKVEPVAEHVER